MLPFVWGPKDLCLLWERVDSNHQSQKGTDLQSVRLPVTGYAPIKNTLHSKPGACKPLAPYSYSNTIRQKVRIGNQASIPRMF